MAGFTVTTGGIRAPVTEVVGQVRGGGDPTHWLYTNVRGDYVQISKGAPATPNVSINPLVKAERYMAQTGSGRMDSVGTILGFVIADPANAVQASGVVGISTSAANSGVNDDSAAVAGYGQQAPLALLSAPISSGVQITSLPVRGQPGQSSTQFPIAAGTYTLYAPDGSGQTATVTVAANQPAGITSLPINAFTPSYAFPVNSAIDQASGTRIGNANGGYFTGDALLGSSGKIGTVRTDTKNWVADDLGNSASVNHTNAFTARLFGQYMVGSVLDIYSGPGTNVLSGSQGSRQDLPCSCVAGSGFVWDPSAIASDVGGMFWNAAQGFYAGLSSIGTVYTPAAVTLNGSYTAGAGTMNLNSAPTGFAPSGQVAVAGITGLVTYTGISGSSLTGCSGGSGTASGGNSVTQTGYGLAGGVTASVTNSSFAGYVSGPTTGHYAPQFNYGVMTNSLDPVRTAFLADFGYSLNSYQVVNKHPGAAVAVGSGNVSIHGSVPRIDSCTLNGTTTVADTNVAAPDVGKAVSGPGIPAGNYIVSVVAGTSFTMANQVSGASAAATLSTTTNLIVGGPVALSGVSQLEVQTPQLPALGALTIGNPNNVNNKQSLDIIGNTGSFVSGLRLGVGGANGLLTGAGAGNGVIQPLSNASTDAVVVGGGGAGATAVLKVTGDNKLGVFNTTPVAQQNAVGAATGYTAGATTATFHSDDTYTGNTGSTGYTINGIVHALKTYGLLAA